jgi:hypothetical protein
MYVVDGKTNGGCATCGPGEYEDNTSTCVTNCGAGYYGNDADALCKECFANCQECTTGSDCQTCQGGYFPK